MVEYKPFKADMDMQHQMPTHIEEIILKCYKKFQDETLAGRNRDVYDLSEEQSKKNFNKYHRDKHIDLDSKTFQLRA